MAREPKCRRVEFVPKVNVFKPAGIPRSSLEEVVVKVEELEAIRLKDRLGLEQEEGAERMGVSRPTFQRILMEGRAKIATALIEGQAIRIEGGNYCLGQGQCRKAERFQKRSEHCLYREDYAGDIVDKTLGSSKILIAVAQENEMVCPHFGQCEYFALFDTEAQSLKQVANPGHEPGFLPGFLAKMGVKVIIAGGMGGRAQDLFVEQGIQVVVGVSGLVKEALDRYLKGELKSTGSVCSEHQHAGD